ncbi:MAG: hypothetical protein U0176_09740 [Bacteroidia bacterium]
MKSGTTFALLLGVATAIIGAGLKATTWPGANGVLMAGIFISVIACVFLVLHNSRRQQDDGPAIH